MRKRFLKVLIAVLCCVALLTLVVESYLEEQGNFHVISPGVAYRSAQLDEDEWEHYIKKFHIRSVINLRGSAPGKDWYEEEVSTCRRLGVNHYDFRLAPDKPPSVGEFKELVKILCTAQRPVLIHCKAGADRSGLVASIWQVVVEGLSPSVARKQLSIWFGHLPFGSTAVFDTFFEEWSKGNGITWNCGDFTHVSRR